MRREWSGGAGGAPYRRSHALPLQGRNGAQGSVTWQEDPPAGTGAHLHIGALRPFVQAAPAAACTVAADGLPAALFAVGVC